MASLYLLIPIAIVFITIAVTLFFWAVEHDQFDDLDGAAHSILFDEPVSPKQHHNQNTTQNIDHDP